MPGRPLLHLPCRAGDRYRSYPSHPADYHGTRPLIEPAAAQRPGRQRYRKEAAMGVNVNFNKLADRYIAIWNEPDPQIRRKLIDELWTEDSAYHNRLFTVWARDMIENVISAAYGEYSASGFTFKSQNDPYGHHNGVRVSCVLVVSATGEADVVCEDFVLPNDEV